ncbi:hypothetical protein MKW94_030518 [Papaver nudicaule]|uniref:Uncharacterized protein n=1 Tax=Papaver nudicaule TaxID=74823 RepID=A0AA41SDY3_PAPNU|nr:hypothetical protein [Papaver nudicaule]
MADLVNYGNPEREIEQALITLKKGTQLIKYSRKGKPKFCPFRISSDETTLIWFSRGEERNLKLSSISHILPGQRTAVFRRYLRPEKEYLSFSLLYNNGERSLDLICKDKVEAEVWFAGLQALVLTRQRTRRTKSDISDFTDGGSLQNFRPFGAALEVTSSIPRSHYTKSVGDSSRESTSTFRSSDVGSDRGSIPRSHYPKSVGDSSRESTSNFRSSDVGSDRGSIPRTHYTKLVGDSLRESTSNFGSSDVGSDRANMQPRASNADGLRISVSSAPSSSSQGSGPDDIESLGDVYVWGEVWCDGSLVDGSVSPFPSKIDVLLPKSLESNVVLDVHQIACGVRHAALVTRQGEVFTWGEESGGRLGHQSDSGFSCPQLVDYLILNNAEYVGCGEYHTCAITMAGDVFTWGDGTQNAGLLGHGTDISHWIPKRVCGPLEGVQVLSVACGTWHTALVTSDGKLFTFGDGTFGVLGHGDRESLVYPRKIESLDGLKTVKVAAGVWHTAAIVEVMGQAGSNISSRKLFTWGDGDKYRLGHGDKDPRLVPTCISALIDYDFYQVACGNCITVALTTSGHVFTMGTTEYGQLGNPLSDGKLPRLVQDKLVGEFIEEVSCGESHVAVLTSRNEVLTWGRGANGRLGHGDTEDRKAPTMVEGLKDRHVKSVSCGSNFTACICIHKWVSGADQSLCSGCRQAFGFTRKRHNCYNCGLVHCHACSSKKALRAALAPTPGKPHRVCDSCYSKLKASEAGVSTTLTTKKTVTPRRSLDGRDRLDRGDMKSSRILLSPSPEPVKFVDLKMVKPGMKSESSQSTQVTQVPSIFQLKDIAFQSPLTALQFALKPVITSVPQPPPPPHSAVQTPSRPSSPYSRRPSPPRSTGPVFSKSIIDSLKKTNELLNQEVLKLQTQVKSLKVKCETQDAEVQKAHKKTQEALSLVEEESSNCRTAKEVIKSITIQWKDMTEKLPPELCENEDFKAFHAHMESLLKPNGTHSSDFDSSLTAESVEKEQHQSTSDTNPSEKLGYTRSSSSDHKAENGSASQSIEVTEQFEAGVYITATIVDGTKIFKRVRFSKRRFANQQAEEWWKENKDRVFRRYRSPDKDNTHTGSPSHSSSNSTTKEEEATPPPS